MFYLAQKSRDILVEFVLIAGSIFLERHSGEVYLNGLFVPPSVAY